MGSITVSKEHGLNPSMEVCSICGETMGVVLFGASYKNEEGKSAKAPLNVCMGNICDSCKKVLDDGGIYFIEVLDGAKGNNPFRTGRVIALKEEAVKKVFKGYSKVNYMERSLWEQVFKK